MTTATCPVCAEVVALDTLVVDADVWTVRRLDPLGALRTYPIARYFDRLSRALRGPAQVELRLEAKKSRSLARPVSWMIAVVPRRTT